MNLGAVARVLSAFTLFFSLAQSVPLAFALLSDPSSKLAVETAEGFGIAVGTGLVTAVLLAAASWGTTMSGFFRREALAVVALAWPLAALLGALPYVLSSALKDPADALFESVSGVTTAGASVLGSPATPAIEDMPQSLLLWRSMEQWLGGMGIVLVFVVLLPSVGVEGRKLISAEEIGVPPAGTDRPRIQSRARALFLVYLVLTVLDILVLHVAGMDSWYDDVCHAFTTMSTGGFSTHNLSMGAFHSVGVECVTIVFMFLAGANFVFLLDMLKWRFGKRISLSALPEVRFYTLLMVGLVMGVALSLYARGGVVGDAISGMRNYSSFGVCLRDAAFNVVSNQTCTGYATANYQSWPAVAILLILVAMFVGGCTGSTSGGVKVMRLLIGFKLILDLLRQAASPRRVSHVRVGDEALPTAVVNAAMALVLAWTLCIGLGTLALLLDPKMDLLSAVSAPTTLMACCGPAMSHGPLNIGPAGSFGVLTDSSKVILSAQMILGRLEILAPLMLVVPGFWRR